MSIALSRLSCPSCEAPLSAGPGDTLFYCKCGRGCFLDEQGLEAIDAAAFPVPESRAPEWEPAWELIADVTISARRNTSGSSAAPNRMRRRFLVPARPIELTGLLAKIRRWSELPAAQAALPDAPILGGDLSSGEAAALARYAVFAEQVAMPDLLTELAVELTVVSARLIAVP